MINTFSDHTILYWCPTLKNIGTCNNLYFITTMSEVPSILQNYDNLETNGYYVCFEMFPNDQVKFII